MRDERERRTEIWGEKRETRQRYGGRKGRRETEMTEMHKDKTET